MKPCPKCNGSVPQGKGTCPHCGLVLHKWEASQQHLMAEPVESPITEEPGIANPRLFAARAFAIAAFAISLPGIVYVAGAGSSLIFLMAFSTFASAAAGFWGWSLAPRLTEGDSSDADADAIRIGFRVPLLSLATTAVLVWAFNRLSGWNDDGFLATVYAVFGLGLIVMGWLIVPVGIGIGFWLQKRYAYDQGRGEVKVNYMRALKSVIALLIALFVFYAMVSHLVTVNSALAYPMLKRLWSPEVVQHFPKALLSRVKVRRFHFLPGFGQSGSWMQIRVHYDADGYTSALARLTSIPVTDEGRRFGDHYKERWHWPDQRIRPPAEDIFVLHSRPANYKPESGSEHADWNHGTAYGYILRRVEREVIYWVASW